MRRGALSLTTAVLGALLVSTGPGASPASAGNIVTVPDHGTVRLEGHGYGHGHGMSQWGAQGAATGAYGGPAQTWRQILQKYYPGTAFSTARKFPSVLLTADTSDDLVVGPRSYLDVANEATGEAWRLPANGATRWRITAEGSTSRVAYLTSSGWTQWKAFTGDGSFFAGNLPIRLYYGSTSKLYRGRLIAAAPAAGSGARDTVNRLSMELYLYGVVPAEMPSSWAADALRAQAVAARSFAAQAIGSSTAYHYDVVDTVASQVYGGVGSERDTTNAAVNDTSRVILTYGGAPAFTQFSSSSGGWTNPGSKPYLTALQDPWDDFAGNVQHHWFADVDIAAIERAFPAVGNLKSLEVRTRNGYGEWGGRVQTIRLKGVRNGSATTVVVGGTDFRFGTGIKSTWFIIR